MNNDVVIKVENVSKKYCKDLKHTMLYGVADIGRNLLGMGSRSGKLRKNEFWAVNDVSFEVKRGETLGLIGPNGSGKTTLLKMLNGIFWPDKGKISVRGKVGALIAVGAGFHPLLTGRENIYLNGAILGINRKEITKKFDAIVDFADIGDFLDSPVKHYSSGMHVRLGFAIAIHCEPDILLIDEILAVGDISFQSKCLDRVLELRKNGVTSILVSHHLPKIGSFCSKSLYILEGKFRIFGDSHKVINEYECDMYKKYDYVRTNGACKGYIPLGGAKLKNVEFQQKFDGAIRLNYGEPIRFGFDFDLLGKDSEDCAFAILVIRVSDGVVCFGVLSNFYGCKIEKQKGHVEVSIKEHNLVPGFYNLDISIRSISNDIPYTAHRENKLVVNYPADKYILKNIAGVFQPQKTIWKIS